MRGNAQDVEPGFLRCDLQSVRREVEQVIRLVTIPARPSRFPGANIGNSQMQQSAGPEPPARRIEKSHRVRDVLEQVIHHYDVEQVVTGKRLEGAAIHFNAERFCRFACKSRQIMSHPEGLYPSERAAVSSDPLPTRPRATCRMQCFPHGKGVSACGGCSFARTVESRKIRLAHVRHRRIPRSAVRLLQDAKLLWRR